MSLLEENAARQNVAAFRKDKYWVNNRKVYAFLKPPDDGKYHRSCIRRVYPAGNTG